MKTGLMAALLFSTGMAEAATTPEQTKSDDANRKVQEADSNEMSLLIGCLVSKLSVIPPAELSCSFLAAHTVGGGGVPPLAFEE